MEEKSRRKIERYDPGGAGRTMQEIEKSKSTDGKSTAENADRDYNVELIRILSFIMVIVIHVTNYYCRAYGAIGQGEYLFSLILNTLSRVSVPCFFMISGAFLLAAQDTVQSYVRRLKRFLLVLAVWSAVYYCWNTFYIGAGYDLREILCVPVERHLWYLYAMIPIYLVLPFFQMIFAAMDRRWEGVFLIITSGAVLFNYLTSLADSRAYYDLPLVGDRAYSYYVFLGYFLYKYRKNIRIGRKTAAAVFVICVVVVAGLTAAGSQSEGIHYEKVLQYGNPLVAVMSAVFFLFFLRLKDGKIPLPARRKRRMDLLSQCSFGIYLIHILFFTAYKKYLLPEDLSAWIAVPLLTAGIAAASFFSVFLLRKWRWGRKIT